MSGGPRVTSGTDSKQDYSTPMDFMRAVEGRFGPPVFDLAAHAENTRCSKYFAPPELVYQYDPDEESVETVLATLKVRGATEAEAKAAMSKLSLLRVKKKKTIELRVRNADSKAFAFDAFAHDWSVLSQTIRNLDDTPGLLWLNCEFSDIAPWAEKCLLEGKKGASVVLLTPAMVGANWYRDLIAGRADVYHLNGRLSFDGKHPYPKDCMLSHFHLEATGKLAIWDWKRDILSEEWVKAAHRMTSSAVAAA